MLQCLLRLLLVRKVASVVDHHEVGAQRIGHQLRVGFTHNRVGDAGDYERRHLQTFEAVDEVNRLRFGQGHLDERLRRPLRPEGADVAVDHLGRDSRRHGPRAA